MEHTLEYALELNASLANFTICTPLPGTEFHEEFRDRIEGHDFNHYDNFHAVFRLDHLSSEEIEDFQEACLVRYYFVGSSSVGTSRPGYTSAHLRIAASASVLLVSALLAKGSRESAGVETAESWESVFRKRVGSMRKRLDKAIRSGVKEAISTTLNDLFRNLSVVRNQIVHGASAGPESRGRTQVILGARLLSAFVPCFRDGIKANLQEDWGEPPFPRVGATPDEKCPPPWLS